MVKIQLCLNALLNLDLFVFFGDATNWEAERLIVVVLWVDEGAAEAQVPSVGA